MVGQFRASDFDNRSVPSVASKEIEVAVWALRSVTASLGC